MARVLATSLTRPVGLAVRERTADSLLVETRRRRTARRTVDLVTTGEGWDVAISTASPTSPGVAELLAPAAVVAAVTQVPSEVELLRELAGDRPWGLVVPGFFAGGADPTWLWPRARFTVAGPASALLGSLFARPRTAPLAAPLLSAAATMPVVAGLHAADFDLAAARRSARR
ncbi:ArsR family transcriptional regulator, partial [Amycolatopsis vancoresmycina DSM 44592]